MQPWLAGPNALQGHYEMRLLQLARKLKRHLFDPKPKPYVPSFAEADLIAALQRGVGARRAPVASASEPDRSPLPASVEDVLAHFTRRDAPVFFAGHETLAGLASGMASSRPQWRERLVELTANDQTRGLPIYSILGPPLRRGFPWAGLPAEPNNDDLYSIRPHRFAFAPRHALAILYGAEPAHALADVLEDWIGFAALGKSEFPYVSTLVVIQRLVALSWAHAFVTASSNQKDPAVKRLQFAILRILHADIAFLLPRLGKCVPNNHLLADRFASWYIRLLFPEFVPGPVDLDAHESLWLAELERQTYPDGTSFEHSLHYHEFVCEMAAAYALLCRRNSRPIPSSALERIERLLAFQVGLAGPASNTIPFGDAIEDPLFSLDPAEAWNTAGIRELYRALFRPELSPASPMLPSVERAFWLLGGSLAPPSSNPLDRKGGPRMWPDGGFAVLPDEAAGARLVFRTGPAPHHAVVAGHMHADLLSVSITHRDRPVLVEAGTWTYRWSASDTGPGRAYFLGPASHNGLVLDAIDPLGAVRGHFRSRDVVARVTTTRCLSGNRLAWMEGKLYGDPPYAGYRRGVVHIAGAYWIIYDVLPGGIGTHTATLAFQAAAGVRATRGETAIVTLESDSGTLWLAAGAGLDRPQIVCGEFDPPGGWVAPVYGTRAPAPQLRYRVVNGARTTAFAVGAGNDAAVPVAVHELKTGLAVELESDDTRDILVLATHDEPIDVHAGNGAAKAAAVWMRTRRSRPESMRYFAFGSGERPTGDTVDASPGSRSGAMSLSERDFREIEHLEPGRVSVSLAGRTWG